MPVTDNSGDTETGMANLPSSPRMPVRRWRDSRGLVHSPNPPSPDCQLAGVGPKGGRMWACGGAEEEQADTDTPPEAVTSQQRAEDESAVDRVLKLIEACRQQPTADMVAKVAVALSELSPEELEKVKQVVGVEKTPEAAKVAKAAAVRLAQREHWVAEAGRLGADPKHMLVLAKELRVAHNQLTQTVSRLL